jgi:hypothetical protein
MSANDQTSKPKRLIDRRRQILSMYWMRGLIYIVFTSLLTVPTAFADDGPTTDVDPEFDPNQDYRGGSIRLGAFAIGNIRARLYFGPADLPVAVSVDIEKDLGFDDRLVAFRANFDYRFSKKHAFSLGYYRLRFDGIRRLARDIEIGDSEFQLGLNVNSHYDETIFKLAYDFIFHDEGRVALSISPGIHFSRADFAITATVDLNGGGGVVLPPGGVTEVASVTAPLPMIGGRILYRMTPQWSMILTSDIFFLTSGGQEGALTDSSILFEYQGDSAFGFGAGLNRFTLDLDIVDGGRRWDWESVYAGAYLYMKYQF